VRAVVEFVSAVTLAVTQDERVCQCSRTRRDMDRITSSEIQAAKNVEPAGRVPGPASDGVVDDSGPDEHEDDTGKEAAALSNSTDCKSNTVSVSTLSESWERLQNSRNSGEHPLVHCIQEIGDSVTSHRGLGKDVHEAEVVKSTDELAGLVGEGKRVAPEEPLERDNSGGHDGEPDEGQGRLASSQTRVEESAVVISILRSTDVRR
jgi:hypothetical protein